MSLKDTCKTIKTLIENIAADLDKSEKGNKAASQRVRTGTIRLEKAAKLYRKESIKEERKGGPKKKSKPAASKKAAKKAAPAAAKGGKKSKPVAKKKPTAKIIKKAKK